MLKVRLTIDLELPDAYDEFKTLPIEQLQDLFFSEYVNFITSSRMSQLVRFIARSNLDSELKQALQDDLERWIKICEGATYTVEIV